MFHPKGPTFFELAQQALSSTRKGYDLLAPKFDYTPFRTPDVILDKVADHLGKGERPASALDLCTGTGAGVEMLLPICTDRIVGFDFSGKMLNQAEKNIQVAIGDLRDELGSAPVVEWEEGDALNLPYVDEFDLVVSFGAFGHFVKQHQPALLDQVKQCLKPGGRFVFVTTYMPSLLSLSYLLGRGFNFSMHVRNMLFRPPFIMFYLTFLLPEVKHQLEERGFEVEEFSPYEGRLKVIKLVEATLRS